MIAFLGMGLLGSNFVRALRRRGEAVRVWNRSPERAKALEKEGAEAFADVGEAVAGARRVHLTLSDDAAVDTVLERAHEKLAKGAILVDHTTTSPTGTLARAKRWTERGVAFQHAPVFMGPQNALEASGTMLASGDKALYDSLAPELSKMTGKLVYLGVEPNRAATFKLMGNSFLMAMTAGIVDVLAIGKAAGLSPNEAASLFDVFNPVGMLGPRVQRLLKADFAHPSWELAMARKDARLMLEEAERGGTRLTLVPGVAARMDEYIREGHASEDWTVIAKEVVGAR